MGLLSFKESDFKDYQERALEEALDAAVSHLPQEIDARRISLKEFIDEAWPIIEPNTKYVSNWHIDAICEHLEAVYRGDISQLVISMPPRHMKSICVAVMFPAWVWTFDPGFRWVFASYAQSLSTRDSIKTRDIIQSPWYRKHWGEVVRIKKDQDQKTKFENTAKGYRIATSVDGSATGEGGDCVVGDDLLKAKDQHSKVKRDAANKFWTDTMSTRQNDPMNPKRILMAQRLHGDDTTGHVLKEVGGYVHLCLSAEYEPKLFKSLPVPAPNPINFEDPREEGELLWPNRFDEESLTGFKKSLGEYGYAAQFKQIPVPESGGILKRKWFRRWTWETLPASFHEVFQTWDMTFKETEQGSYVVGQVWGKVDANFYLLWQVRGRWDFVDSTKQFVALCEQWPVAFAKYVEEKANGAAIISTLRNKINGLIAVQPQGSKVARTHAIAPSVQAGNVYVPEEGLVPWIDEFMTEVTLFPNAPNDDQVDAMTQGLSEYISDPMLSLDF